jgi:hypothetical protein
MPNQAPKASLAANAECFHCKEIGHWKRNCKLYLASLKNKGRKGTSASVHFMFTLQIIFSSLILLLILGYLILDQLLTFAIRYRE